ncbi:MAG TPA: ATP-binding protein [Mycobacteriales bacterium]|nr:ATP-binding protein [Mycobacteriales bacterium]
MLLRFWVANHASIRKEQELSLVALDPRPEAPAARTLGSGVQVLPVAGIFGANASGKSKIVEALQFMRSAVVLSHQRWLPEQRIRRQPFLLDQSSRTRPSRFEVEIALGGVRYRYGFTCDDTRFREEWLHAYPKNRRRALFERADDGSIKFGEHLVGEREAIRRVTRSNSLFLSAAAANNHEQLSEVHRWFAEDLRVAVAGNAGGRLGETLHIYKEHERDDVLRLLRFADLGIDEVEIGTRDVSDAERRLITDLIRLRLPDGEKFDPASVELSKISLRHGTQFLPIEAESSGTRTWLELIGPIVSTLRHGDLLVVDELDARLHPSLAGHLVKLFQDPDTNPRGAQLVFNTHDVTLLGPNTPARLRRDEIWLTEKDPKTGATRLFPLTEYRIRDSLDNVERAYLRGRYGAVPFIDETLVVALGEAR